MPSIVRSGRGASATTLVVDVTGVRTILMVRGNSATSVTCSSGNVTLSAFDTGGPRRNMVWNVNAGTSGNVTFTANNSAVWVYICLDGALSQSQASYISNNTTADMSGIGGNASAAGDLVAIWDTNNAANWTAPLDYTMLAQITTQNAEPSYQVGWKTLPSGAFTIPAVSRGKEGTSLIEVISWALLPPTGVDSGIPTIAGITRGGRVSSGTFTVALPASSQTYFAFCSFPDAHTNVVAPSGWTLVQQGEYVSNPDWTRYQIWRAVGTPGTSWTYNSTFQSINVVIVGMTEAGVVVDSLTTTFGAANGTTPPTAPAVTTTSKALVLRASMGNMWNGTVEPNPQPPLLHALRHSSAQVGVDTSEWFNITIASVLTYAAGTVAAATFGPTTTTTNSFAYPLGVSLALKLGSAPIPSGAAAFTYNFASATVGKRNARGAAAFAYDFALGAVGRKAARGAVQFVYEYALEAVGNGPPDPGVPTLLIHDGTTWVVAEVLGIGDGSPTLQPCQILEPPN